MEPNNISENKYADVPLRIQTWVYIIVVLTLGISHVLSMRCFVSWIGFQVFWEFLNMYRIKGNRLFVSMFLGVAQLLLLLFFDLKQYMVLAFIPFALVMFFLLIKRKAPLGIAIGLVISLYVFPHLLFIRESVWGVKALLFLVLVTECNDVFQYLTGKSFGRNKIVPNISPNKTIEGFIGGVFLTILLSNILGYFLLPSNVFVNTLLGLTLGVFGFWGDIFMSGLKRKTNIKDTGTLLPGHGGLLDRMDSLLFNTPIFFCIIQFLSHSSVSPL